MIYRHIVCVLWGMVLAFCAVAVYGAADDGEPLWSYHTEGGVSEWCNLYKTCCGKQQSPVNFDTNSIIAETFAPLSLKGYDTKLNSIKIKNNGHAVYVDVGYPAKLPVMSDGGINGEYSLVSFHFHWGSKDKQGAEHTVDGVYYPLELHVVHFNTKYGTLDKALKNPDGLAVLGVFYELSEKDNPALDEIVKGLSSVVYNGDSKTISKPRFSLQDLFPVNTEHFFRYSGSLTTPPCDEVVTWTVFEAPQTISLKQLNAFRALKSSHINDKPNDIKLSDNYRPVQTLKGRKVLKRHVSDGGNSVSAQFPILFTAAASALGSRLL